MAPNFIGLFKNYFIDPWLNPDKGAFVKAVFASGALILISWNFMDEKNDWKDYTVPALVFGYVYIHSYDRGEEIEGDRRERAIGPTVRDGVIGDDINDQATNKIDLDLFLTELRMVQGKVVSSKKMEALIIMNLNRDTSKEALLPFNSIAKRRKSDERYSFLAASREGMGACQQFMKMSSSSIECNVAYNAGPCFYDTQYLKKSSQIIVYKVNKSSELTMIYEGHVATLERFLDQTFGSDSDSD